MPRAHLAVSVVMVGTASAHGHAGGVREEACAPAGRASVAFAPVDTRRPLATGASVSRLFEGACPCVLAREGGRLIQPLGVLQVVSHCSTVFSFKCVKSLKETLSMIRRSLETLQKTKV